jgi:hypothetical protein
MVQIFHCVQEGKCAWLAEGINYLQHGEGFSPAQSLDPHSINSLAFDLDFRVVCLRK